MHWWFNLSEKTIGVFVNTSELSIEDKGGRTIERYKIPYGTTLNFPSGSNIKKGNILAKWDPLTRPIIAEVGGKAMFVDIEDGITARLKTDELTGLSNIEIIDLTERAKG